MYNIIINLTITTVSKERQRKEKHKCLLLLCDLTEINKLVINE